MCDRKNCVLSSLAHYYQFVEYLIKSYIGMASCFVLVQIAELNTSHAIIV